VEAAGIAIPPVGGSTPAPATPAPDVAPTSFRPTTQDDLAPSGAGAKVAANVSAVRLLRELQAADRPATVDEQQVLARWSGWGAVPAVFDERSDQFADARSELKQLLDEREWRAASKTTLNAHYTDAALAQTMWDVVTDAGFGADREPVRVLEPGCGAGTFIGLAPAAVTAKDSALFGVELDPTTAAIAKRLYPHADIRQESFAATLIPRAYLDLVIGNVPFGRVALHDPVHNGGNHSLHNYFVLKSLALTRPGGVVTVLTSHYTMDATNPAARREIAALADLVAAVRLPMSAHQRAAGTQVITDVLVLRRRDPADGPGEADGWVRTGWMNTVAVGGDAERQVNVNEYFATRPDRVIGEVGIRSGQFGPELEVKAAGDVDVALELRTRLGAELARAAGDDPAWTLFGPRIPTTSVHRVLQSDAPAEHQDRHIAVADGGRFSVVIDGQLVEHQVPASQSRELTSLLGLRDTTVALLAAESATAEDSEHIDGLRRQLNTRYDAYAKRWGPINRITYRRTGRVDEVTGEDLLARIAPPQGRFKLDPHSPAVYALEDFDAAAGTARKAPIMSGRVVAPRTPRLGADTPADAVAICLDTHGEVHLPEVARLLGRSEEDTRHALTGLVFADPSTSAGSSTERLIPAPEYLSGNVRIKLAEAETAAERDAASPDGGRRWDANIAALRQVLPVDLTPAEIDARLGASWIGADVVQQFLREILEDPNVIVEHPGGSTWAVRGGRHNVLSTSTYGTERMSAGEIVGALLEQRQVRVSDEIEPGKRVLNLTETVAAQEKASEIGEKFSDWIWSEPDRASRLARHYNDTFNAIVLRSYDGAQMQLPGLTLTFTPREHQTAAVARIVSEPSVLLAHEVGAGKTAEMVIGAMELRRLGMAQKPAVVVPNHMLEQFSREWMQLYPKARILAASIDDLSRDKRRLLVARIATGDWDAVILSRSAFERVPLSVGAQQRYLDTQLAEMRRQLDNAKGGHGLTVKRLEGALARAEERLKKLTDGAKDPGITFEETGIDYLMVDEAHGYKNLRTVSNIQGVGIEGSQRASDLDMKLDYLRERHGGRVATFATATPIANSVSEAFTMQRFLRPDLLDAAGLTDFDTWAATFGEVTTDLELAPDGSRFRMQSRFAKFRNVPELLRMWHVSADIKTAEDLQLPTPALRNGQAETVVVPATEELSSFMGELSARADKVQARQVPPEEDNMLRVATHGRMAALDLRLLGRDPGEDAKLAVAATRIAALHHASADRSYPDAGNPGVPGSLQLVFCDLGTPSARSRSAGGLSGGWNAYDELKQLLVERGVPAEKIRYVHEARNDKEKGEMFAAARNGRISVLLGSTEKMGVGTNVQARAIALHHLDCPWRPADIAQREGRLLRQGNLNPEVEVIRYVCEGSFDAYLWQTVERKARFIGQVMRGSLDVREIEDVGDTALSYSEVKALATGDPRILEKARVDAEMTRLERLERAHGRNQRVLSGTITKAETDLPKLAAERHAVADAIGRRGDTSGDRFSMSVNGTRWSARADAAIALRNALAAVRPVGEHGYDKPTQVATIAGFDVIATARRYLEPHLNLELDGVPRSSFSVDYDELRSDRPLGIVVKLENRAADLERTRDRIQASEHDLAAEAARARSDYGQPFAHTQALAGARARSGELAAELAEKDQHHSTAGEPATRPAPSPSHTSIETAQTADPPPSYPASSGRDWAAQPPRSPDEHAQMARDAAADTFAARVPIPQMDRPSVERELGHIHGDTAHYTNAHAARDALTAARDATADTPAVEPASSAQPDSASADWPPATSLGVAPPGGWTAADRVQPVSRDTSSYLSAQRYPLGTELTVHAVGEDGPCRRMGHGVAVDHPGPQHVTVESPFGTKRVAPISHVSFDTPTHGQAQRSDPGRPAEGQTPDQQWAAICDALDARVTADPHWPALAAQLERAAATGTDVAAVLAQVTADNALPDDHPARNLAYRVADIVPDLRSPARMRPAAPDPTPRPIAPPPPAPSIAPDTYRPGPRR
jgi:N12 class adenine-specific DNA methylase